MPRVEEDPDVLVAGLVAKLGRLVERRHDRPVLAEVGAHRLEPHGESRASASSATARSPATTEAPRVLVPERPGRAGQAYERRRLERREPPDARAQSLDPLGRILGTREVGKRQDRRHRRDRARRLEAARPERFELLFLAALLELDLADADPACAGGSIRGKVVLEARS